MGKYEMNIKELVKRTLGWIRCYRNGIIYHGGGVYVGKHVHFKNTKNITIGKEVSIRPYVDIFAGNNIIIGDRCDIGTRNRIVGEVVIESDVLFGPDVFMCSSNHVYEDPKIPIKDQGAYFVRRNGHDELKIGRGSWIGVHAAIIGDVHIGRNCVVGANAVVTRDIPDFCVVIGAPAKIVKKYNNELKTWVNVT